MLSFSQQNLKKSSISFFQEYVKTDPRGRIPDMTMTVIKQGAEPVAFKSYFVAWEPQMWTKKMSYEDQLNAIKQGNEKVDENAWSMVCLSFLAVVSGWQKRQTRTQWERRLYTKVD